MTNSPVAPDSMIRHGGHDLGSSTGTTNSHDHAHGSDSSGGMHGMHKMNTYLTTGFEKYPVLFQNLYAETNAQAFGIFLLIMLAAYIYKALLFISWCLEVKWFKTVGNPGLGSAPVATSASYDKSTTSDVDYTNDTEIQESRYFPKLPSAISEVFCPTWKELGHDLIRVCLFMCSTLIVYLLMLIAMTFIWTYIFGVVLGLALSEVFFNRFKIILLRRWELKRELEKRRNCPGGLSCSCGFHKKKATSCGPSVPSSVDSVAKESKTPGEGCCCEPTDPFEIEKRRDQQVTELSKQREQSGNMDAELMPSQKFV